MENGYVIAWVHLQTGEEGKGTLPMTKVIGEYEVQALNEEYAGSIFH